MEHPDDSQARRPDEPIYLRPYDPRWPVRFRQEAAALEELVGPWITGGIHHVGSTAIPGLAAKPVIDIQVGVADLPSSQPCIDLLADMHYHYAPYRADAMHWFCKPDPVRRTHHLHLVPTGSPRFKDVLVFRDYLRAHPAVAANYETLKRELARSYPHDREAYTGGKAELIRRLTDEAHAWRDRSP